MNVFDILREKFQKEINNNPSLMPEAKYWRNGIYDAIKMVDEVERQYNNGWIPVSERYPESDSYILLSFKNFTLPTVGRYEVDEEGGAFFVGDDDISCVSSGLYVNAWQPLPKRYEKL